MALGNRVTEPETGTNHWSDETTSLETKQQNLTKQVASLSEDLEGRSCRNNLWIIGLIVDIEGIRPTDFIANVVKEALQLDQQPLLDRVHRSLQPRPQPGERPRHCMGALFQSQGRHYATRKTNGSTSLRGPEISAYHGLHGYSG